MTEVVDQSFLSLIKLAVEELSINVRANFYISNYFQ